MEVALPAAPPRRYPPPNDDVAGTSRWNGGGTATGVTATEIKVGQIYVATGPVSPSTGQVRGAQAYVNYVNSIGGVYGRKLSLDARDDSLDPTKDASACAALVPTTFALVASQSTAVGACAPLVKSSGIPGSAV